MKKQSRNKEKKTKLNENENKSDTIEEQSIKKQYKHSFMLVEEERTRKHNI